LESYPTGRSSFDWDPDRFTGTKKKAFRASGAKRFLRFM
jgi:hypothetical protein